MSILNRKQNALFWLAWKTPMEVVKKNQ